jgi:demethylmenaquinone methyltransferase / 2-methoxy-6-polyprenyl-1,4-benzoquinol methylase
LQGEALADRMRAAGLVDVRYRPFTLGVATLYVGTKPLTHSQAAMAARNEA